TGQAIGLDGYELLGDEAALARIAPWISTGLAKIGTPAVEDLDAVVAAVADVDQSVLAHLHAVHGIAEECRLHVARGVVLHPDTGGGCGLVVDRVVAVRAEVPDVLARRGIEHDDAAIAVAIRHVHAVAGWIDVDVGGQVEQRRAVPAAIRVVAVRPLAA